MNVQKQGLSYFMCNQYSVWNYGTCNFLKMPRSYYNVSYLISGTGVLEENGIKTELKQGDFFLIPKGSKYVSLWKGSPCCFITVHFDFPWQTDPLRCKRIPIQILSVENPAEALSQLEYLNKHQSENDFMFSSIFFAFCHSTLSNIKYEMKLKESAVQPAVDYIEVHFAEKLTVKELADICCLSEPHFYARFKQETSSSPIDYKNKICIQHAMQELISQPEKSIESIALEHGFDSVVYFRRLFKNITGLTPTEYRNQSLFI